MPFSKFKSIADVQQRYHIVEIVEHRRLLICAAFVQPSVAFLELYEFAVMGKPLIVVMEAKQDDFTGGWGHCLAE